MTEYVACLDWFPMESIYLHSAAAHSLSLARLQSELYFSLRTCRREKLDSDSWLNVRFRAQRIDHISMTEYVVNSSGWDHSPESSPFLFTFSFSLLQFPFLLESFDWHVSHHLIPSMTQVSFCTTMSIMFLMLLLNCFSGQSLLCTSSFYRWLFSSFSISVIIHFFDYRYESFHRTFPPAWPIMWKSIPSNRLILFRIPVHLPLICDYKSYTSICL